MDSITKSKYLNYTCSCEYIFFSNIIIALVALYEEPERPLNPLEYIKQFLGGPNSNDAESLRQENEQLKLRIKELEERLNKIQGETQHEES